MEGLTSKFIITKASGQPVDPRGKYFVLRYDNHQKYDVNKHACLDALWFYAWRIRFLDRNLARDLIKEIRENR